MVLKFLSVGKYALSFVPCTQTSAKILYVKKSNTPKKSNLQGGVTVWTSTWMYLKV